MVRHRRRRFLVPAWIDAALVELYGSNPQVLEAAKMSRPASPVAPYMLASHKAVTLASVPADGLHRSPVGYFPTHMIEIVDVVTAIIASLVVYLLEGVALLLYDRLSSSGEE